MNHEHSVFLTLLYASFDRIDFFYLSLFEYSPTFLEDLFPATCSWVSFQDQYTRGSLLPQHAPATCSRNMLPEHAPSCVPTKNMLRNKSFAPGFCSPIHTRELAPETHCNIFAPSFCSLISNQFDMREQNQGANVLLRNIFFCTRELAPGACCGSVLQEQAPSCVPALTKLKNSNRRSAI